MAPWVKRVFLHLLPRLLLMRRPAYPDDTPKVMVRTCNGTELQPQDYVGGRCPSYDDLPHYSGCRIHGPKEEDVVTPPMVEPHRRLHFCPDLQRAMESVHYIADHTRRYEDQMSVKEDWKYVAMVLDRLFLWIFSVAVLVGTCGIILHAPTLYDTREPIDMMMSEVAIATFHHHRGLT